MHKQRMGPEADEPEPISTPKLLPLIIPRFPPESSPEDYSGRFYTSASIPFLWEEEPGKPRPRIDLITAVPDDGGPGCLDLPPRLQSTKLKTKTTKLPSPTTVGPCADLMQTNIVSGISFGFKREHSRKGSNGDNYGDGSPESGQLRDMVLIGNKGGESKQSRKGLFGSFSWRRSGGRKEEIGGGHGFGRFSSMENLADSSGDEGGRRSRWERPLRKIRRIGSFPTLTEAAKSTFWATMYEGFKQVLPWKSKQAKNEGLTT